MYVYTSHKCFFNTSNVGGGRKEGLSSLITRPLARAQPVTTTPGVCCGPICAVYHVIFICHEDTRDCQPFSHSLPHYLPSPPQSLSLSLSLSSSLPLSLPLCQHTIFGVCSAAQTIGVLVFPAFRHAATGVAMGLPGAEVTEPGRSLLLLNRSISVGVAAPGCVGVPVHATVVALCFFFRAT